MAPPPGRRALRPVLQPGDLLAGRYRLQERVAVSDDESADDLWRAVDEVLARPVAVKVLRAAGRRGAAAARPFLEAAARAGTVVSPLLARVDDAAVEERPAERAGRPAGVVDVAYVVREWVEGRDLATVLREDGPWEPVEAAEQVAALAEALHAAHARGVVHGRVHPGNVVVTASGELRLTDLALSSALPDGAAPAARADDPTGPAADVRDLTAVLYALLTGRWPAAATPQPAGGVPPAPAAREREDRPRGRLTSPRQVRAGVPRALDALVVSVLGRTGAPAPATGAALADAVEKAVRDDAPRPVAARSPRVPPALRRKLPALLSVALLVLVGVVAYGLGREVGEIPPPEDPLASLASPAPGAPAAEAAVDLASVPVVDFDPPPGDGRESPGAVANAFDGDGSTAWTTERYSAEDLGTKPGVGLLVDLGAPTVLDRVELVTTGGGVDVELRVADAAATVVDGFRVVATGTAREPGLVLTPPAATSGRYWLVWITGLAPADGGGFRAGVSEMRFLRG